MTLELVDRSITRPKGVAEDVFVKVGKFNFPTDFVVVDFEADPRVPLILGRSFLRTGRALIDVFREEITLRVNDEAITFNLNQTTRYSSTYDDLSVNQIDIIDVAREEYAQEILGFSNISLGGNPTSTSKPILSDPSPFLTPLEGSDFILEEIKAYLKDESISSKIDHADFKAKSSIEEPPESELKDLPSHLEYAYLEGVDKLPVIIAKDLKVDEKEALLKVLKSHKGAIAWKIINIKDHSDFKYLLSKQDAKLRLIRWVLLLQEFDIIIHDKKGTENLTTDHLSRLENPHKDVFENKDINEKFPLETLGKISSGSTPWFAHFVNFHAGNFIIKWMSSQQKKKFFKDVNITSGTITTFFGYVRIKSFDGVCMDKKLMISSKLVMKDPSGAIMVSISLPRKQVEVSNRGLKRILERTVGKNRASWSKKLDDALWAFRTASKTPIGCTLYKLVYGKSCDHRKLQLNELHDQAYENSLIYKEKTKKLHDSKIKNRIFNVGDRVLLFNSRLKMLSGKLKTHWSGHFTITRVFPYVTIELSQPDGPNFKVNGHRVKHYFRGDVPQLVVPDLKTFPMDK
uniref:Reverse transcriptase domain-containing protein n=1 Tax=Tanacetum cinerariifolium TaxID=118510 RepID=A0A6L2JRU2_TANCI|nr:reverse transcriptase domain-containing protein [Tanacetum cinerariifolium]